LHEGVVGAVRVTLGGECAGVMSKLGDGGVDFEAATTCLDAADPTAPVPVVTPSKGASSAAPSVQGTFAAPADCPGDPPVAGAVCVPGGAFVLGGVVGDSSSVPPRIAAVSTFWIDTNEVTIRRLRSAFARGFKLAHPTWDLRGLGVNADCLWTPQPGAHEDYAVTCMSWYGARAFCRSEGGDLPTEAQWEYAATGGGGGTGGGYKTTYPWGYDPPQCTCGGNAPSPCHAVAFGRSDVNEPQNADSAPCAGMGPLPVSAQAGDTGDTTPLGVVGLAGGVAEMMRDSYQPYASDCWRAQGTLDPMCWEAEAPERPRRSADFEAQAVITLPVLRELGPPPSDTSPFVGFRCVYPAGSP
jgi:sulfatase modifying factor 1